MQGLAAELTGWRSELLSTSFISMGSGPSVPEMSGPLIGPGDNDAAAGPAAQMYFTAVTNKGTPGGIFGYLKVASTDLTQGNDQ
jgi:hypothetical protein